MTKSIDNSRSNHGAPAGPPVATTREIFDPVVGKLLSNVLDSVSVFGPNGKPIWASLEHRTALGHDRSFWRSNSFLDLVHPDDQPAIRANQELVEREPGAVVHGRARVLADTGVYETVSFSAVNHMDDPDIDGVVLIVRPNPDEPHDRDELEQERQRVSGRQTDMIARFSHEIRSPLHTILGTAELLATAPDLSEEQRTHLQTITNESQVLRVMIDDILDLSRLSAGQMELTPEVFSPAAVVDDVGRSFGLACADKNLDFDVRVATDVPPAVRGDALRLRQALVNLVSNAVRYTNEGCVRLEATRNTDGSIRFEVGDSGPGIPSSVRARIFEPFTRGDEGQGGTGLGLTITKQLIELMGGTLGFETGDDGTSFWCNITFGQARRASDIHPHPPPAIVKAGNSIHVLVVDDSEVNRLLASSQLERLGYGFQTAESGEEALERLESEDFDAVLMDWHMPGLDGLEATRRWRAGEMSPHPLPIITMTASAMAGDRERCLDAGATDYLSKPVSITDLGSTLARWTGAGRAMTDDLDEPSHENEPGHDDDKFRALVEDLGNIDIVRSVVHAFVDLVPQYRQSARRGLESGDAEAIRRCAHTVRSTAVMLGADDLAATCRLLEQSRSDDRGELEPLVDAFDRQCREAASDLAVLASTLRPAE